MQRRALLISAFSGAAARAAGERIRIAFLGGSYSHGLQKARILLNSPAFELVGIWEEEKGVRSKYESLGVRPLPLEQILSDKSIAAVAVESDIADHGRHGLMVLEADKHLHLEKPPATNWEDFRRIVSLAESRRLVLQTGYMWRYNPGFVKLLEAARNGWLGDVYQMHGVMNTLLAPQRRPDWGRFRGGQMFEQGGYMIDAMVRLLGRPSKVSSWLRRDGKFDDALMDNTVAVLEFPRALGVVRCAALQPNAAAHRALEIQGTNGTAVLRPVEEPELVIDLAKAAGPYEPGPQKVGLPPYARFKEDFVDFAAAIRGEKGLAVSLQEELLAQETLLRACGVLPG
jgi:predicted dehydrogenase